MSNDLVLKNTSGSVDEMTRAIAGFDKVARERTASKRISLKGMTFRKIVGGKEVAAIEDRHMNVIFVNASPTPSRTYYSQAYKEGERIAPSCWSSDSKVPDPEVKSPQASACEMCPQAIDGSGLGGQGKACRFSWRTAVVLPDDPSGDVMQLVVPGRSAFAKEDNGRWGFKPYVQHLARNGRSISQVVTKMQFDVKSPVAKLMFSPVSLVPEEAQAALAEQAKSEAAINAVKFNVYQSDEGDAPPEPVLRESKKPEPAQSEDVSDVIKKWSKKK